NPGRAEPFAHERTREIDAGAHPEADQRRHASARARLPALLFEVHLELVAERAEELARIETKQPAVDHALIPRISARGRHGPAPAGARRRRSAPRALSS